MNSNPVSRASRCIRSWKSCGGALPAACSCPEAMAGEMGLAVEAIEIMVVTLSLLKKGVWTFPLMIAFRLLRKARYMHSISASGAM